MNEANMYYNILSASWVLRNCLLQCYVQCHPKYPRQEDLTLPWEVILEYNSYCQEHLTLYISLSILPCFLFQVLVLK